MRNSKDLRTVASNLVILRWGSDPSKLELCSLIVRRRIKKVPRNHDDLFLFSCSYVERSNVEEQSFLSIGNFALGALPKTIVFPVDTPLTPSFLLRLDELI